jgi:hypothetical protein
MFTVIMKKIFIIAALLFIAAAESYSQGAYLQLSLYDDGDFTVTFDDTRLTEGNLAEFDNVTPGEHYLRVVKTGINVPAQENVIYDGKIKLPAGDNYAVIDEYNAFIIYKKKPYATNRYVCSGDFIRKCGFGSKEKESEYVTDECKNRVMKKADFDDLKSSIGNRSFESTNVTMLKSALENNFVSSEQLRELLGFFTFETNKLDVAKYAYKKVCDTKNFFKVYDAFTFDSSVEELKNYILGK